MMAPSPLTTAALRDRIARFPRTSLALLPTPIHRLARISQRLNGAEIWIKRDDLTGLAGGGNKTRKLEFLVGEALREGADTLVSVGAIQSNHVRQTAAAAACSGLSCELLLRRWVPNHDVFYERAGNVLLSRLLGAELHIDSTPASVGDETGLDELVADLRRRGRNPYKIPGGASDHPLGGLGYALCAAELVEQAAEHGVDFDTIVVCTGSGSTTAGLLAGLHALGSEIDVLGVDESGDPAEGGDLVFRLANGTLQQLEIEQPLPRSKVTVLEGFSGGGYGIPDERTWAAIHFAATTEGLLLDPVYEGKSMAALIDLCETGRLTPESRVLFLYLGGAQALHAYAGDLAPQGDLLGGEPADR